MLRRVSVNTKQSGKSVKSVLEKKRKAAVGRIYEKEGFKPGMKEWRDDGWWVVSRWNRWRKFHSKELGDAELERLVRGWRRGAGSWFRRRGEAYWKERSVIRREDDVDGRASVTKYEYAPK